MIGTVAAIIGTGSFLPQTIRTVRTGSAADLSWLWLGAFLSGLALWSANALLTSNAPLAIANICTVCLLVPILYIKRRGPRTRPARAHTPTDTTGDSDGPYELRQTAGRP